MPVRNQLEQGSVFNNYQETLENCQADNAQNDEQSEQGEDVSLLFRRFEYH